MLQRFCGDPRDLAEVRAGEARLRKQLDAVCAELATAKASTLPQGDAQVRANRSTIFLLSLPVDGHRRLSRLRPSNLPD